MKLHFKSILIFFFGLYQTNIMSFKPLWNYVNQNADILHSQGSSLNWFTNNLGEATLKQVGGWEKMPVKNWDFYFCIDIEHN